MSSVSAPKDGSIVVPRIFHQTWLGPDPFPDEFRRYQATWLRHHPVWELRFWTEGNLPSDLRRPEAADRLRNPTERSDILRFELLWRFGGIYVDVDFECLRSIEPLIQGAEFFIGLAKPGRLNGALFGSAPGHPLLDRALEEMQPREFHGYDKDAAGPRFLDRLLIDQEGVRFIEPAFLYPRTPEERQLAYGIHHEARSWKSAADLRLDVERAEQKLRLAQDELALVEKRYRLARAELDAVREARGGRALLLRARRRLVWRLPRERIRYVLGVLRARALGR